MKGLFKFLAILFLVGFLSSCRDTKNEEEINAAIQQVDSIEMELDSVSNKIETDTKELVEQMEELDSI